MDLLGKKVNVFNIVIRIALMTLLNIINFQTVNTFYQKNNKH